MSHHSLDHKPRQGRHIYQAGTCVADLTPGEEKATSYSRYHILARKGGALVLNTYGYSPSTARQILKLRRTLAELGIVPDLEIDVPPGLQERDWVDRARAYALDRIARLQAQQEKGRPDSSAYASRAEEIAGLSDKLAKLARIAEKNQ